MKTFCSNIFHSLRKIVLKQIECTKNIYLSVVSDTLFLFDVFSFRFAVDEKTTALHTILYERAKLTIYLI